MVDKRRVSAKTRISQKKNLLVASETGDYGIVSLSGNFRNITRLDCQANGISVSRLLESPLTENHLLAFLKNFEKWLKQQKIHFLSLILLP